VVEDVAKGAFKIRVWLTSDQLQLVAVNGSISQSGSYLVPLKNEYFSPLAEKQTMKRHAWIVLENSACREWDSHHFQDSGGKMSKGEHRTDN